MSGYFIGWTINDYHLTKLVGVGGHGVVYQAHHPQSSDPIAVKVILPEHVDNERLLRRIRVEAEIIRELRHPHIVPLYDYWEDENGVWIAMRWVDGGDLRDQLKQQGPLTLDQTATMLSQISGALDAAHAAEIIHRDIKPENILQDREGHMYLTDFGIAKRLGHKPITKAGIVIGSPFYLSPEQIMGYDLTARTDVYGMGIMLYELLTGEHPFASTEGKVQLMVKHVREPVPDITKLRPDVLPAINDLIQRATAKDPQDRYPSASALARHFHEIIAEE